MFDLRAWLRRSPKPRKLRLTVDDDEKIVDLGKGRCKWAEVEQTVLNARASLVECLDDEGSVLRSYRLEDTESDAGESAQDKAVKAHNSNMAAMFDAYGKRLVDAFNAGAGAASSQQDHLVGLVENLTGHLSVAITNLHAISTNYANLVQSQAHAGDGDGPPQSEALMGLLAAMIGGKGLPSSTTPAATAANGKKT
ncbi:MAG: hypothetical protein KGK07_13605 [Chloroflexota bacterium]|nr:hypothetical protein [Chloroflexota bacterium]